MSHTILLIQPGSKPETRTYSDYESVTECIEGVVKIFEGHLIRQNPNIPLITYDLCQLFHFLDQLADLSCLVYQKNTNSYAPYNKDWIKEKIYVLFKRVQPRSDENTPTVSKFGGSSLKYFSEKKKMAPSDCFHDLSNLNKGSLPSKLFSTVRVSVSRDKFVCNICNRHFDKKCYLNLHMKYHNFQCAHCHRVFIKKIQLRRHLKKLHPIPSFLKNPPVEDYKCKLCAIEFESKYLYKMHLWHYHRYIYVCQKTYCGILCYGRKQYDMHRKTHFFSNCFICGKICKNISSHMRSHLKKYHCEICSKNFATSGDLKKHVLIHLKMKPFSCAECGKTFYQRFGLVDHLRTHFKKKMFSCKVCFKSYVRSRTLKNHMAKHIIESYKVFQCDKCSFTTKIYHDLRKHKKAEHSFFFQCNVCQKILSSQEKLDTHMFTHSEKKPISCSFCVRDFVSKGAFTRHMKRFHPS